MIDDIRFVARMAAFSTVVAMLTMLVLMAQ